MKIFIDTANIDEIKKANDWGLIDGVTTNPSLVAKECWGLKSGGNRNKGVNIIIFCRPFY